MAETQQVIIEFVAETSQLDTAIDQLEKTGAIDSKMATAFKQTNAEIAKQSAEIKKVAASTAPVKKNLEDIDKATKQFTKDFMTGFNEGVIETLKEAGVSVEQFTNALKTGQTEVQGPTESLRARLKSLTQQIAEMKLAGDDGTETFKNLVIEAGNIKDAMGDAAAEIKNAGSDTRTFDNLLGAAQAVAGGFAVAQGAAALFGDENEELQQTLLKVNAAMAILQGLQQISNALEKEGAITKLGSTIATKGQVAAQVIYNTVVGTSIGLMKALRIAFALTGIGALILGITALTQWLMSSSKATKQLIKDLTAFNDTIEAQVNDFNSSLQQSERIQAENTARLKERGALQSQIYKQEIKDLKSTFDAVFRLEQEQRQRAQTAQKTIAEMRTGERSFNQEALDEAQKFLDKFTQLQDKRKDIANEIRIKTIENEKQLRVEQLQAIADSLDGRLALAEANSDEEYKLQKQSARAQAAVALEEAGQNAAKRLLIERELKKQLNDLDFEFEKRKLDNELASVNTRLEKVKAGTKDELNLRINQAKIEAALEQKEQGLSAEKRLLIEAQFQKKIQQLRVEFFNKLSNDTLSIEQQGNIARIADVKTTDEERLNLQLENIEIERVIQLAAAKGNAAEEIRINNEAEQKKLEVKKNAIDAALQYDLSITETRTGALRRANEQIAANETKSFQKRVTSINQLAALDIAAINRREDALDAELMSGLISQKEYNDKYAKLKDDETKITEDAENKKTDLIKAENKRREEVAFAALNAIATVISDINANQTEQESQRIEAEKQRVAELLEAGAITEEEANKRNKRIEAEEKKLKREQAQREKNLAIFNAVINTAQAITAALASAPPPFNAILAAISAALGAAQIAAISSRPLPRFGHGKKSGYQGIAEIGETGPELYEQNGKMYIADKKQLVWLAAQDKVYNPTETKEMLMPVVDKQLMQWQAPVQKPEAIDYDKLAKAIGKNINIPGFNIDEQGFKIWQQQGQSRTNYMDKRYSSK